MLDGSRRTIGWMGSLPSHLDDAPPVTGRTDLVHGGELLSRAVTVLTGRVRFMDRDTTCPSAYRAGLVEVHGMGAVPIAVRARQCDLIALMVDMVLGGRSMAGPPVRYGHGLLIRVRSASGYGVALLVMAMPSVHMCLGLHGRAPSVDLLWMDRHSAVPAEPHVVLKVGVASLTERDGDHLAYGHVR